MTVLELDKHKCTGCGACTSRCVAGAIKMTADPEGFAYPGIDLSACIDCGVCAAVCPSLRPQDTFLRDTEKGFLAVGRDRKLIFNSSSGGVFAVLADYVINTLHGVVYGACMDDDFTVRHHGSGTDIVSMQGSKYIQSDVCDTYAQVRDSLKKGIYVLYSGTPCQIAGLVAYLDGQYEKLLTLDLVCHGVSSPGAFRNYISYLESETGKKIAGYRFRNKTGYDKNGYVIKISFADGCVKYVSAPLDIYFRAYLKCYLFRPSCYSCAYAQKRRAGDITIGDCGTAPEYPFFHADKCVSSVLINTRKGLSFWQAAQNGFDFIPLDLEAEQNRNGQLNHPSPKPELRDEACALFVSGDFASARNLPGFCPSVKERLLAAVRMRVPWRIRVKISRFIKIIFVSKIGYTQKRGG